jgi:glycosyltransferase involved in cell wall biosynthesis
MMKKKKVSIVTPCFNEEGNVYNMYIAVKKIFTTIPQYKYEHLFVDNCSEDNTASILRNIASQDKHIKVIINSRNFGPTRSGGNAILQASGDRFVSTKLSLF